MGLDARLVYFAFTCLPVVCLFLFYLYYRKNQVVTIFLQAEEIMGREKTTNQDANRNTL